VTAIKTFNITQLSRIRESLASGRHLVLQGRPRDARRHADRFRVKVYDSRSEDIIESISEEQRYRHYLGFYTNKIGLDELREDIESVLLEKHGVAA